MSRDYKPESIHVYLSIDTLESSLLKKKGLAQLKDFDATLLILLLRNLSKISPPKNGWHNLYPLPSDLSLGADLLRLRSIRNDFAHIKNSRISNADFGRKFSELTIIVTRVGGLQFQREMTSYASRHLEIGRLIKTEIEQIRKEFECRLPENIKAREKKLLERGEVSKTSFVKTKAYKHSLRRLKTTNVITITGALGSGKKTLATQLCLHLSGQNFEIVPINDCQEIFKCCHSDENQIFVIHDPFGTQNLDTDSFAKWSKYNDDICNLLDASFSSKMIFTCGLQIFKRGSSKSSFEIFYRNTINISEGVYGLTYGDKQALMHTHRLTRYNSISLLRKQEFNNPSFPLLCKAVADGSHKTNQPICINSEEIENVLKNLDYSFILHLVLAYKNKLHKEVKKVHQSVIKDIQNTFRIKVPLLYNDQHEKLLNELEGTFLKETDGIYSFINDTLYDILAYNSAWTSTSFALKNCSKEFFRNNLTFSSSKRNRLSICLQNNDFECWFERLETEIGNGCFLDILFCSEFADSITQELLLQKVRGLPVRKIVHLLEQTENEICITRNIPASIAYIIQEFAFKKGINLLCALLIARHYELFGVFWNLLKKSKDFKYFDSEDLLKAAMIGGNVDCFDKLVKALWKRDNMIPFFDLKRGYFFKKVLGDLYPMCMACACGHLDLVKHFHNLGFDINETNKEKNGTLAYAARCGYDMVVQYLISNNVNIDIRNNEGITPLMLGIRNYAIVEMLLQKGANFEICGNNGENILTLACGHGNIEVVKLILRCCRNLNTERKSSFINKQKFNGFTSLHKACESKDSFTRRKIAQFLLDEGASPRTQDHFQGSSPLHLAVAYNDIYLVWTLIYMDADVNRFDKDSVTSLFIASENGFSDIVECLISCGADYKLCRKTDGASPLLISAERGHLEVVKILLENIKDEKEVNCVNNQSCTPLLMATLNNHTKVCELLLSKGADVNIANANGYSPILVASRNGNSKLINSFLQYGSNIDSQTFEDKNTPLHFAVMMGNKTATKILLTRGADMEIKNEEGLTPSVLAEYMNQGEILDLLIDFRMYGAGSFEFQTKSVQSPRTQTSLDSSKCSSIGLLYTSKNYSENTLSRIPSTKSIADSSAGSVIYSDRCSHVSTRSLCEFAIE